MLAAARGSACPALAYHCARLLAPHLTHSSAEQVSCSCHLPCSRGREPHGEEPAFARSIGYLCDGWCALLLLTLAPDPVRIALPARARLDPQECARSA